VVRVSAVYSLALFSIPILAIPEKRPEKDPEYIAYGMNVSIFVLSFLADLTKLDFICGVFSKTQLINMSCFKRTQRIVVSATNAFNSLRANTTIVIIINRNKCPNGILGIRER